MSSENNQEKGFYHPSRGYWQTTNTPPQSILDSYPEGTVSVDLKPSEDHQFDGLDWVHVPPTDAEVASEVRGERDGILSVVVDPLVSNPLRWSEMTPETQAAWAQYRQDLLNVPQQEGFPHSIVWPTQP